MREDRPGNGEKLFADSTLIRANASLDSVVPRSAALRPNQSVREHVEQAFSENPVVNDDAKPPCGKGAEDTKAQTATDHTPLEIPPDVPSEQDRETVCPAAPVSRGRPPKPRRDYTRGHVSRTDPDASIITRPVTGTGLFYKQHSTVDSPRLITAVLVTSGAVDDPAPVTELLNKQPVTSKTFCADTNYGVPGVYADLKRKEVQPIIPRRTAHMQKPRPRHLHASTFRYDPEMDVYYCPRNKTLCQVSLLQNYLKPVRN